MKKKKTLTLDELDNLRAEYHRIDGIRINDTLRLDTKEILFYLQCAQEAEKELEKENLDAEEIRLLKIEADFCLEMADGTVLDEEREIDPLLPNFPAYKSALIKLKQAIEKLGYLPGDHITKHLD